MFKVLSRIQCFPRLSITLWVAFLAPISSCFADHPWRGQLQSYARQISDAEPNVAQDGLRQLSAMINQAISPGLSHAVWQGRLPEVQETRLFFEEALSVLVQNGFSHPNLGVRNFAADWFDFSSQDSLRFENWIWLDTVQTFLTLAAQSTRETERATAFRALAKFAGFSEKILSDYYDKYGGDAFATVNPLTRYSENALRTILGFGFRSTEECAKSAVLALMQVNRLYRNDPQDAFDGFVQLTLNANAPEGALRSLPIAFDVPNASEVLVPAFIRFFVYKPDLTTTDGARIVLDLFRAKENIAIVRSRLESILVSSKSRHPGRALSDLSLAEVIVEHGARQTYNAAQSLLNSMDRNASPMAKTRERCDANLTSDALAQTLIITKIP